MLINQIKILIFLAPRIDFPPNSWIWSGRSVWSARRVHLLVKIFVILQKQLTANSSATY